MLLFLQISTYVNVLDFQHLLHQIGNRSARTIFNLLESQKISSVKRTMKCFSSALLVFTHRTIPSVCFPSVDISSIVTIGWFVSFVTSSMCSCDTKIKRVEAVSILGTQFRILREWKQLTDQCLADDVSSYKHNTLKKTD